MLIYISSAMNNDSDYELVGSIKKSLLKDEHEIVTFHEIKERYPNKDEEFYITTITNMMNQFPFDLIIFMPGWVQDKKSNVEIIQAQFAHTNITEYKDGQVVPIVQSHDKKQQ